AVAAVVRCCLPGLTIGPDGVVSRRCGRLWFSFERSFKRWRQPLPLDRLFGFALGFEVRQHLASEQLDRFADVLVLVAARLTDEDDLVAARCLISLEQLANLRRRADRPAQL